MRPQRKDSIRSRKAIIDAAEELFVKDGDVSFAEISIRAGVAQATVYRHFRDRSHLLAALMSRSLDRIEAEVDSWDVGPQSFESLLRLMAGDQAKYQGLIAEVRRGEVDEQTVEKLRLRTSELFREPLAIAKARGRIGEAIETDGIIGVLNMIDGAVAPHPTRLSREEAGTKAVDIILDGLRG